TWRSSADERRSSVAQRTSSSGYCGDPARQILDRSFDGENKRWKDPAVPLQAQGQHGNDRPCKSRCGHGKKNIRWCTGLAALDVRACDPTCRVPKPNDGPVQLGVEIPQLEEHHTLD